MNRPHLAHRIGLLCVVLTCGVPGLGMAPPGASAVAASGSIAGHVSDSAGQPMTGTLVTAVPQRGGPATRTMTDSRGEYRLEGLPENTYRVDFMLLGFEVTRRNAVGVRTGASANADAVLFVRAQCECVTIGFPASARTLAGQVVDEADRPLPGARLEIAGPMRESSRADSEGRFGLRLAAEGTWTITASESGFHTVTRQISGTSPGPLVLRLRYAGTRGLPDTERFGGCDCPGNLFTRGER